MPVLLRPPTDLPTTGWDAWVPLPGTAGSACDSLDPSRRQPAPLDDAFAAIAADWLALGQRLSAEPSAGLAHAPACAGTISDLGEMLAWTRLVDGWAAGERRVLCLCADPWLFRHLAGRPGVTATPPPPLRPIERKLALRGLLARLKAAGSVAAASLSCRAAAARVPPDAPVLLVYGHPASRPDGFDAYFGELMGGMPELHRVLHTDCPPARANALGAGLHGWGSVLYAATLPFRHWRPRHGDWLVRRAAAREGGTGTPAMLAWQRHCQQRFLDRVRPRVVAWPWENHAWERDLVRTARCLGVRTLGCQHATIGTLELNYADGDFLPDAIACSGPAGRDRLAGWGLPAERLWLGGAWRFPPMPRLAHDPDGPVFLALPVQRPVAAQMLAAAAASGRRFLVREHPMTPVGFAQSPRLSRSPGPLAEAGVLSAVVFAATSVGLEAALGGLPVVRFLPDGVLANDVLPPGLAVAATDAAGLAEALERAQPIACDAATVFTTVDPAAWRERLA
jgi:hypothetical protein